MKNLLKIALAIFMVPLTCSSQELTLKFEKEVMPDFFDYFTSAQQRQFYLSADGSTVLLNTEQDFLVMDMSDQGGILKEGSHITKVTDLSASVLGVIQNKSLNREDAVDKLNFKEGTEYLVFDQAGIILFLDWNVDRNVIKAVDFNTGEELWKTEEYRYTPTAAAQFANQFVGVAIAQSTPSMANSGMTTGNRSLLYIGSKALNSMSASPLVKAFILPLEGTGKFMLKTKEGYTGFDLRTGKELWQYNEGVTAGFKAVVSESEAVLVNFNSSYFKNNDNILVKLDLNSGKEIWRTEHLSNFRAGRTMIAGDRIICDYYGAEVFDLGTGQRILLSIDEKTVKAQNTMTTAFMSSDGGPGTESIASPSVVEGDFLYTSTFKLGPRIYANDGSSKAMVQKYNLKTGEKIWESEKLQKGTDLNYANEKFVFVRNGKAFGKSSIFVLDAATGEVKLETENVDGFVYRTDAGDVLSDDNLYRSGKKNLYAFDLETWKMNEFDVKKVEIGKLQACDAAHGNLMLLGDKGITFFDKTGDELTSTIIPVLSCAWNADKCYIFSTNQTVIVGTKEMKTLLSIPYSPEAGDLILLDEMGKALVAIENENNSSGKKVMKYYRD